MSSTICFIQARMGSKRLPGKVMKPLAAGRPVLWHVVGRVRRARKADAAVVATSILPEDDRIAEFCEKEKIPVFRGDEQDVLSRFTDAARAYDAGIVVRITADCPLVDSGVIDALIAQFSDGNFDYLSNAHPVRVHPQGFDVELCLLGALERAYREATDAYDREHVMPFFYRNPNLFRIGACLLKGAGQSALKYNLSIDTEEDFKRIQAIYAGLYRQNNCFTLEDVLHFVQDRTGGAD